MYIFKTSLGYKLQAIYNNKKFNVFTFGNVVSTYNFYFNWNAFVYDNYNLNWITQSKQKELKTNKLQKQNSRTEFNKPKKNVGIVN